MLLIKSMHILQESMLLLFYLKNKTSNFNGASNLTQINYHIAQIKLLLETPLSLAPNLFAVLLNGYCCWFCILGAAVSDLFVIIFAQEFLMSNLNRNKMIIIWHSKFLSNVIFTSQIFSHIRLVYHYHLSWINVSALGCCFHAYSKSQGDVLDWKYYNSCVLWSVFCDTS